MADGGAGLDDADDVCLPRPPAAADAPMLMVVHNCAAYLVQADLSRSGFADAI